jgi:SAM-dependent methyltransferase
MGDPVGSTSWRNRNLRYFLPLADWLRRRTGRPRVILVGPGAVTRVCAPLLRDAANPGSRLRGWVGDLARYADQAVRRLPFMPLVSLEAVELRRVLNTPHDLTVVDVSRRVLAAVARDLPTAECRRVDLVREPLGQTGDIVIALNVVSRVSNGHAATAHLANAVRPGGLLLIDDRSAGQFLPADQFRTFAAKTHVKIDCTAAALT